MNVSRAGKMGWAVTVLAVGATVFLFMLARQNDPVDYRASVDTVREIQQLAADWSIETARVRSDPLADFDSLAAFIPRMDALKQRLLTSMRSIPDVPDRLANDVSSYVNAVEAREERIERFKTGYAIIRNSARYLPLAASTIVQAPDADAELTREVSSLASDVAGYLNAPSDADKGRLTVALERLGNRADGLPEALAKNVVNFIAHAEVLLAQQAPTGELFAQATSSAVSDLSAQLVGALGAEVARRSAQNDRYFNGILIAVGILALAWLAVAVASLPSRDAPESEVAEVADAAEPAAASAPAAVAQVAAATADWTTVRDLLAQRIVANSVARYVCEVAGELRGELEALDVRTDEQGVVRSISGPDYRLAVEGDLPHERLLELIASMESEAGRLAEFAGRQRGGSYALIDLNDCVDRVVRDSGAEGAEGVAVSVETGEVPEVFADADEVRLMLDSVVQNSLQAIAAGGREDGELKISTAADADGAKARVTVIDNGIGMSPETRERIFEPFFSECEGRDGIGLVCTSHLAEKYGGAVSVSSMPGGGTVTRISLPGMTEA